jgi:carbon-monoxide dehydrogenase medium subunit
VAAVVRLDANGICEEARIVVMNAGAGPVVARRAAGSLVGFAPGGGRIAEAAAMAATYDIAPRSDVHASAAYRRHLADVIVRRALARAFGRARPMATVGS